MSTSNRKSSSSDLRPRATGGAARPSRGQLGSGRPSATRRATKRGGVGPRASAAGAGRASLGKSRGASPARGLKAPRTSKASLGSASPSRSRVGAAPSGRVPLGGTRRAGRDAQAARSGRSAAPRTDSARGGSSSTVARRAVIVAAAVAALAAVGLVALLVLSHMPVFVISGIDATASEHVSAETIAKLAAVDEGTTLLSVDVSQIQQNVRKNPWVKNVNVTREFPDTLGVSVEERTVSAIVVMGSGTSVWALGDDGVWIEPVQLDTSATDDATSAALAKASELGCLLIANAPSTVDPAQGAAATDEVIIDVLEYQRELPESVTSQAQVYYAASTGSISVVLQSGLEVSLGSATDISAKASALQTVLDAYGDKLTYVNVRVPSKPSYRKVADGTSLKGAAQVVADNAAAAATTSAATTGDASGGDSSDEDGSSGDDEDSDEGQGSSAGYASADEGE